MVVCGYDLDGLNREGLRGVLGEHGDEDIIHNFSFRLVGGSYIDEDVAGFEADFRVVGVDYWGHGADSSVCVEDDGIDGGVPDNMEVP